MSTYAPVGGTEARWYVRPVLESCRTSAMPWTLPATSSELRGEAQFPYGCVIVDILRA